MDRRKFLGLFGLGIAGVALDQAIPLGRVWSFPKNIVPANCVELMPGMSIRFIQAYDPNARMMLARLDVLYGKAELPNTVENAWSRFNGSNEAKLVTVDSVPQEYLASLRDSLNESKLGVGDMRGIYYPELYPLSTSHLLR